MNFIKKVAKLETRPFDAMGRQTWEAKTARLVPFSLEFIVEIHCEVVEILNVTSGEKAMS